LQKILKEVLEREGKGCGSDTQIITKRNKQEKE
jgi:hypothetical protein